MPKKTFHTIRDEQVVADINTRINARERTLESLHLDKVEGRFIVPDESAPAPTMTVGNNPGNPALMTGGQDGPLMTEADLDAAIAKLDEQVAKLIAERKQYESTTDSAKKSS